MKLSTVLCFSFMALGTSKVYSATDTNVAVDGAFTSEAEAAGFNAENPGLVTALADMVASATFHPLLRGSFGEKDPVNLAIEMVECSNGMTSSGKTCEAACNDGIDCCGPLGSNACNRFTGKVAKDGSCMGTKACEHGSVGLIYGASCVGDHACYLVGANGSAGPISGRSCRGYLACRGAGEDHGSVGSISGASCVGENACIFVGAGSSPPGTTGAGGSAGSISGASCIAKDACYGVGQKILQPVGDLASCCKTERACNYVPELPADCKPSACDYYANTGCDPSLYCSSQLTCKPKKGTGEKCVLRKECISGKCSWSRGCKE